MVASPPISSTQRTGASSGVLFRRCLLGTRADAYTECAIVLVGLGDPPGTPLKQALWSPWTYGGCAPAARYLDSFSATDELPPLPEKMRYWHGYAPLTRPALALFGLTGTR
jgi:hypothetical protein